MAYRELELTLQSARDLKNVNLIMRMEVYAVVTISGDPLTSQYTAPDRYGGRHPTWNTTLKFKVPPTAAEAAGGRLHVILRAERFLGDRDVGEAVVPLADLLAGAATVGPQLASYQVRPRGWLSMSYRLGPVVSPHPPPGPMGPIKVSNTEISQTIVDQRSIQLHTPVINPGTSSGRPSSASSPLPYPSTTASRPCPATTNAPLSPRPSLPPSGRADKLSAVSHPAPPLLHPPPGATDRVMDAHPASNGKRNGPSQVGPNQVLQAQIIVDARTSPTTAARSNVSPGQPKASQQQRGAQPQMVAAYREPAIISPGVSSARPSSSSSSASSPSAYASTAISSPGPPYSPSSTPRLPASPRPSQPPPTVGSRPAISPRQLCLGGSMADRSGPKAPLQQGTQGGAHIVGTYREPAISTATGRITTAFPSPPAAGSSPAISPSQLPVGESIDNNLPNNYS